MRGTAWRYLGDAEKARGDFRRAFVISPKDPLVAVNYAFTLPRTPQGRRDTIEILEDIARHDPLDYWHPFTIAGVYDRLLDRAEAERNYLKALRIRPEAPTPSAFYGIFLAQTGRIAEGMRRLELSAKFDAADPESYTFPATAFLSLGDFEGAADYADRAIAINPNRADAVYLREAARYLAALEQGDAHSVVADIDARLQAMVTSADSLFRRVGTGVEDFRALLALDAGDAARALQDFEAHTPEAQAGEFPRHIDRSNTLDVCYRALHARLLKLAGETDRAAVLDADLAWITEDSVPDLFGSALNEEALWFLVETRAGFVPDEQVIGWLDRLHELGAFYEWRPRLMLSPGIRMIEDREGLDAVIAKFEASMAAAREELASSEAAGSR